MNTLALNVDYVLRTGPMQLDSGAKNPLAYARMRYESVGEEKLVSGSDDFTLFLWKPEKEKKPIGMLYLRMHLNQCCKKENITKIFFFQQG